MKRILLFSLIAFTAALPVLALEITTNRTENFYFDGTHFSTVNHGPEVTVQDHPDDPISVDISIDSDWYLYTGEDFADCVTVYSWSDTNGGSGGYVIIFRLLANGTADVFSYTSWGDDIWWD